MFGSLLESTSLRHIPAGPSVPPSSMMTSWIHLEPGRREDRADRGRLLAGRVVLAVLASGVAAVAAPGVPADASWRSMSDAAERTQAGTAGLQALETFDAAWEIVRDTHFDPLLNGVDWEEVRDELRPRAARATDVDELRAVLRTMLSRIGQSHFRLWPGDVVGALERARADAREAGRGDGGDPGIDIGWIDGRVLVTRVERAAAAAGVRPGWEIVAVGEQPLQAPLALLRERVEGRAIALEAARLAHSMLRGAAGSEATVRLRDDGDELRRLTLTRNRPPGRVMKFGNLPPMLADVEVRRIEGDGVETGLIRFDVWLPLLAPELDAAVERLRDVDGMVIDLRGNPGGVGAMVMGFAGHFLDEALSLGTMRTRENELRYVVNPRRVNGEGDRVDPFRGPLALVVDATTGSTSEVFAGGLQALGRARVFGERTAGAVLPSLMDRLPNGDVLQHAVADFVTSAGDRLEGVGVVPDETVETTREGLLAGRDEALEAALRWIAERSDGSGVGGEGGSSEGAG